MKKSALLMTVSLFATAIVDVSFFLRVTALSCLLTTIVFFLASYLLYEQVMEKLVTNSILVLFFLLVLMSYGYTVNAGAYLLWTLIITCSITGYIAGLVTKKMQKRKNTLLAVQRIDK